MSLLPNRKELNETNFIAAFRIMQHDAAVINKRGGFSDNDPLMDELEKFMSTCVPDTAYERFQPLYAAFRNARVGLKLALVMSELSETLEAVRKNLGPDDHIPTFTAEEAEIADATIRLMNYATDRKLRLAEAIVAKNEFNRNRPDHSKESRAAEHGKKF